MPEIVVPNTVHCTYPSILLDIIAARGNIRKNKRAAESGNQHCEYVREGYVLVCPIR